MASRFELMHLSSDCHMRMLLMCNMSTIKHLYCTCSTWKETVLYASQYDHRLWCIMHKTAPASLRNKRPEPGILPNLPTCLLHLCPPEHVDAFHTHTYICHSHPPDLEWATHEVKRMVKIDVAKNPLGMLGVRGYLKQLQQIDIMRLRQQPYAPHQEKYHWSYMRTSISLPVLQAACAILVNYSKVASGGERLLHEVAALRSEAFWWIDIICKHLADESTQRRPQPVNKPQYRWLWWPMTATRRRFRDHQVPFAKTLPRSITPSLS